MRAAIRSKLLATHKIDGQLGQLAGALTDMKNATIYQFTPNEQYEPMGYQPIKDLKQWRTIRFGDILPETAARADDSDGEAASNEIKVDSRATAVTAAVLTSIAPTHTPSFGDTIASARSKRPKLRSRLPTNLTTRQKRKSRRTAKQMRPT